MFVASKGLEIPWVQGFLHVLLLGFASRGRELKAGHVVRKIRELSFIEMCENTLKIVVCACTLPGGLEDCDPYLLGCFRRFPVAVDHAGRSGIWEERSPCPSAGSLC